MTETDKKLKQSFIELDKMTDKYFSSLPSDFINVLAEHLKNLDDYFEGISYKYSKEKLINWKNNK